MVLVELNWLADAELLGRIGRQALIPVLEGLAPLLAQVGAALPDPGLDDALYFPKLAAVLRSQPVKVAVCLAPFRARQFRGTDPATRLRQWGAAPGIRPG